MRHPTRLLATVLIGVSLSSGAFATDLPPPLTDDDFIEVRPEVAKLGQLLFYDPILSGNRNISCATCHHPSLATGDGVSLGLGEGGIGLGPKRVADPDNPPEQRIPRNSPALFNLGFKGLRVLFHDGRIEVDPSRPSGFRTPLEDEMAVGFSGLLSAQTMFPVLSADEMAGHYQENEISTRVRQGRLTGPDGAWDRIAKRVREIPEYRTAFHHAYPETQTREIGFADISNAIADFMAAEWRATDSPFDRSLRGELELSGAAREGMTLFYGDAGCSTCHAGPLLTDQSFHAMGQPQLGPGKAARFERHQNDIGRARVTGRERDMHAFRTPALRNVTKTGPWGHAGAFSDLRAFLRHHADPVAGLESYEASALLPAFAPSKDDWTVMQDLDIRSTIANAVSTDPITLDDADLDVLLAFLDTLTDLTSLKGRLGIPDSVPSGLEVER